MNFLVDRVTEDTFFDNLLLGLSKILDKNPRIKHFYVEHIPGASITDISNWEQYYSQRLPEDLKEFYLSHNGFKLTWHYTFSDTETIEIGSININSLQDLVCFTQFKSSSTMELRKVYDGIVIFKPGTETRVYQLAYVDENAKVCLVYYNLTSRNPPAIWLYYYNNHECTWFFLAKNIRMYFRMCIAHLGMPLWQYCFTPYGIPQWAEQVYMMTTPHLEIARPISSTKNEPDKFDLKNYHLNGIDSSIFKPKQRRTTSQSTNTLLKYRRK